MEKEIFDVAVVGAGPAGLSAALYALRANRRVILFEGKELGGLLNDIKQIDNYPAFESITGQELSEKMTSQVLSLDPVVVRQFVLSVIREGDEFRLFTPSHEYTAKRVIFCTGVKRSPLRAANAFKGSGISYCAICDGFFYKGKTVAVFGTGYTALEDAAFLSNICKKVYWIAKSHANAPKLENLELVSDDIVEVLGKQQLSQLRLKSGRILDADGLFVATGTHADTDLLTPLTDETALQKSGRLGRGAYVAGDAMGEFKQIVWACATGAHAATQIFKS